MNRTPLATPESRPSSDGDGAGDTGDGEFRWDLLVPHALHPIQVAIVEALLYIDQPLAPSDLVYVFGRRHTASHLSYHVTVLEEYGALELVGTKPVRGVLKHWYVLKEPGRP